MPRLSWDDLDVRHYIAGVDSGVFYNQEGLGVPWNGLISVVEAPTAISKSEKYIDGEKYLNKKTPGSFAAKIDAFTYPEELVEYEGYANKFISNQEKKTFGLSYRVYTGDEGYLVHLVYNAHLSEPTINRSSLGDDVSPSIFSWNLTTTPIAIEGSRPSAHLIIDSRKAHDWAMDTMNDLLYGSLLNNPTLPSPATILDLFEDAAVLRITDHGDGTFTAYGPDDVVYMTDPTSFEIAYPSAVYIDTETYEVSSL